jgi:hypothetical protein
MNSGSRLGSILVMCIERLGIKGQGLINRDLVKSIETFHKVIAVMPKCAQAYSAIGLIAHARSDFSTAILKFHQVFWHPFNSKALALKPTDNDTKEMLEATLKQSIKANHSLVLGAEDVTVRKLSHHRFVPDKMMNEMKGEYQEKRESFADTQEQERDGAQDMEIESDAEEAIDRRTAPTAGSKSKRRSTRLRNQNTPGPSNQSGSSGEGTQEGTPRHSPRLNIAVEPIGPRTRGRRSRGMSIATVDSDLMDMDCD